MLFLLKTILSGLLAAGASTLAKKYPGAAGILVALPVTTFITMMWMGLEGTSAQNMATFLQNVGWITLAGIGVFFFTPLLIRLGWGFWPAFGAGLLTLVLGSWAVARWGN